MSHPSDDLILESVGAADGPPRLIQIARAITLPGEDEAATGYLWSTGRLSASREGDRVHIRRSRSGGYRVVETGSLCLDPTGLQAVQAVCRDWARQRESWAAFWEEKTGIFSSAVRYRPAGPDSEIQTIGRRRLHEPPSGETLQGHDAVVPLAPPREPAPGVVCEAEIWRRGENHGPPEGSQTGLRYRLAAGLTADATRRHLQLEQNGALILLEPDEPPFIDALVRLVGGGRGGV